MIHRKLPADLPTGVVCTTFEDRKAWEHGRTKIGGSDAAAIVGMNPYISNRELWEIKTGRKQQEDISDKPYVRYGNEAEKHLRTLFALDNPDLWVGYLPNNMFLNSRFPFAHASLDGWLKDADGRNGVLEIKTTNVLQSMQKEKWKDRIPDNYYIQVLHYLMVTGFDFVILKAQLKFDFGGVYLQTRQYRIERQDVLDDIEYLEKEEARFWESVESKKEPGLVLPGII